MGFHVQQLPDGAFFGVFRTGRVSRRRANPLVIFADQILIAEVERWLAPNLGYDAD